MECREDEKIKGEDERNENAVRYVRDERGMGGRGEVALQLNFEEREKER